MFENDNFKCFTTQAKARDSRVESAATALQLSQTFSPVRTEILVKSCRLKSLSKKTTTSKPKTQSKVHTHTLLHAPTEIKLSSLFHRLNRCLVCRNCIYLQAHTQLISPKFFVSLSLSGTKKLWTRRVWSRIQN